MRLGVLPVLLCVAPTIALAAARPAADLCVAPPGAQPMLPARLLEGQGITRMPVTTRSEEARLFFNQGVSQVHSFWFHESERSFLQAAALDPDMAMAYWGIALCAAADYRPAFQLLRDPGRRRAAGGASRRPPPRRRSQRASGRRGGRAATVRAREASEQGDVAARRA